MKPIGILYLANSAKIGGGNRVLMDLVIGLDRSRFAPFIVTPGHGSLADWAASQQIPCRPIEDGDWAGRAGLMRRAAQLSLAVAGRGVRIVHAMAPGSYRAGGLAGACLGAVRVCHLGFPPEEGELQWSFQYGPEAVVACYEGQARDVADDVRRARPESRLLAIPNAIDTDTFVPAPDSPARERWRFGARHVMLIVGHLSDVKGYPTFLRAAAKVQAELGDCAFVLLGGETVQPGFGAVLERLADDLGIRSRVHFLGWRPEVAEVMQAADLVALPSLAEGLPIAILEAMACGKPVVSTPVNGVPEAVEDGVTGLLVPPSSVDALASAMLRVLRDPAMARRMGEAGRRAAEIRFSRQRFVSSVEALYDDLLRNEEYRRCSSVML
jgi:glycosyltransferase involved in cell wall biosynthesis